MWVLLALKPLGLSGAARVLFVVLSPTADF